MLEKLKEYKELIAIVTFFLGGFFWLQAQYPSKSNLKPELDSIHCLVENHMKLTQWQFLSQQQERELAALAAQLAQAPVDGNGASGLAVSPAMRAGIEQLKLEYAAKRNQLGQTTADMTKLQLELERALCDRRGL
jgi:hypothetical protein